MVLLLLMTTLLNDIESLYLSAFIMDVASGIDTRDVLKKKLLCSTEIFRDFCKEPRTGQAFTGKVIYETRPSKTQKHRPGPDFFHASWKYETEPKQSKRADKK